MTARLSDVASAEPTRPRRATRMRIALSAALTTATARLVSATGVTMLRTWSHFWTARVRVTGHRPRMRTAQKRPTAADVSGSWERTREARKRPQRRIALAGTQHRERDAAASIAQLRVATWSRAPCDCEPRVSKPVPKPAMPNHRRLNSVEPSVPTASSKRPRWPKKMRSVIVMTCCEPIWTTMGTTSDISVPASVRHIEGAPERVIARRRGHRPRRAEDDDDITQVETRDDITQVETSEVDESCSARCALMPLMAAASSSGFASPPRHVRGETRTGACARRRAG